MKSIAFIGLLIGMLALSACGASGGENNMSGNAGQTAGEGTQESQPATASPPPSTSGEWTDAGGGGESSSDAGSAPSEPADGGASADPQASADTDGGAAEQPVASGGGTPKPSPSAKPASPALPSASPSAEATGGTGEGAATEKPASEEHVVEITNFRFSPSELEIRVGDTVKFVNKDEIKHTATADEGKSFDTDLLGQDESKTVTFDEEGEFGYHCTPHPGMKGTIVVKGD